MRILERAAAAAAAAAGDAYSLIAWHYSGLRLADLGSSRWRSEPRQMPLGDLSNNDQELGKESWLE